MYVGTEHTHEVIVKMRYSGARPFESSVGLLECPAMRPKEPFDDRDEVLARYQRGVMTLLFILAAAVVGLIIWLGLMLLT
jgi:hypothetical protein